MAEPCTSAISLIHQTSLSVRLASIWHRYLLGSHFQFLRQSSTRNIHALADMAVDLFPVLFISIICL